jgi:hypothetical protein
MAQNRKPPAYQEYPATMLASRNFKLMNIAERGLLYTIRLECWENKEVPASVNQLAKYIGFDVSEVQGALTNLVKTFLHEKDGLLTCPELDDYRQHLEDRKSKQSAGGKNGATITNRNRKKMAKQGGVYLAEETGNPQVPRRVNDGSLVKLSTVKSSQEQSLNNGYIDDDEWINDYNSIK